MKSETITPERMGRRSILASALMAASAAFAGEVPRQAPEFEIREPSGEQHLLSAYRNRVVALEFLLTTCPHCQNTSRLLSRLGTEYAGRGFQALGVAFNADAATAVPEFVRQFGVTYPVGVSPAASVFDFLQLSAVMRVNVPILVLIDRSGNIRGQYTGGHPFFANEEANLRAQIEQLLREAPKPMRRSSRRKSPR